MISPKKISVKIQQTLPQLVKFATVGVLNTLIDFIIFYLLSNVIDDTIAKGISFLVAVVNSFVLNRYWTFGKRGTAQKNEMAKFLAVNLLTLSINLLCYHIWSEWFHLGRVVSFVLTMPFVTLINYMLNRIWVFGSKEEKK